MDDKYAVGSFCGMVFNASIEQSNKGINPNIENLIQRALQVRIIASRMVNDGKNNITSQ